MRIVFTQQSLESLEQSLKYMRDEMKIPMDKVIDVKEGIFTKVELLKKNPNLGQKEELLTHLTYTYRRLIYNHFKIVYRIEDSTIYVIDVFDSRQSPTKMKK